MEAQKEVTFEEAIESLSPNLDSSERKKLVEVFEKAFTEGIPIKDSLGLNQESIEFIYSQGYRLYLIGKYVDALKYFNLLYVLNPKDPRFAYGIAACFQKQKDYEQAIGWYFALTLLDPESPMPFYYLSDCFLNQKDPRSALYFLNKVVELSKDNPIYSILKERTLQSIGPIKKEVEKIAS